MKKILLTGSCGFIGSNFIKNILSEQSNYTFVGVDNLINNFSYSHLIDHPNYKFYLGDFTDEHFIDSLFKIEKPDIVINMGAFSFVCQSVYNAKDFIKNNVYGNQNLLDASIKYNIEKFIFISTDEIYGHLKDDEEPWYEDFCPKPRNNYSISKYSAELSTVAASEIHGLKFIVTRSCNIFGPRQPRRNLLPVVINSIFKNQTIPIRSDGSQRRCWDYVYNKCDAIMYLLENSPPNEIYNLGPGVEMTNIRMANKICDYFGRGHDLIKTGYERKGIDHRYAVNTDKLYSLGFKPKYNFDESFTKTMKWYENNLEYLDK